MPDLSSGYFLLFTLNDEDMQFKIGFCRVHAAGRWWSEPRVMLRCMSSQKKGAVRWLYTCLSSNAHLQVEMGILDSVEGVRETLKTAPVERRPNRQGGTLDSSRGRTFVSGLMLFQM